MENRGRAVIIGGGLTAARAAEGMREEGYDGEIVIATSEARLPYERPPLSKGYLLGDDEEDVVFTHDAEWYAEHDVEVRTASLATALDADAHTVEIEGHSLGYDRLLIATGASPRRFPGRGGRLRGVHHLRRLEDATALRAALEPGDRRVAVIGAGWIGLETAAAARHYGNEVVVISRSAVPLEHAIGPELGEVFAELHREQGVELRLGAEVQDVVADDEGAVAAVRLEDDGPPIDADLVIVGVGALPNTALAASAGLVVVDGIATDAGFLTSAPDVYAAGDAAAVFNPRLGHHLRVEHWANALNGGFAAGRAMAGAELVYDEIPYFYTDQYDLGMEYSGYGELAAGARLVIRGDLEAREFVAFWLDEGRVVAGMNVNVWEVNETVQRLIRSGERVDPDRLADTEIALETLVPAG